MRNILIILRKEWWEITQQRNLLMSVIMPPLIFALLPIALLILTGKIPSAAARLNTVSALPIPTLAGLSTNEFGQALVALQFSILYLALPAIIPSVIAAYSIVGEKNNRTLEPLLATPVKTWELLVGKCIAAVLPAVIATWVSGIIFVVALSQLALSPHVFEAVVTSGWLVALFLWTPVLGLLAVAFMTAISSRVNDPRTAEQFSAWFVVPLLLVFFGQMFGIIVLGVLFALLALLVLVLATIATFWIVTRLFQREVILTRWK
ncbi:MAG TPA: ABC transporter permease subunit [Ktedonobacteraceae bacterium]|nr:ABC transporter permease subunit [Ktedonobacteraceae bacterium]